uniref:Uncharacterized protein n=1 Tax=Anopheles christyi TaxID=43041 RepID=A0A182K085_9DIPT
LGLAAQLTGGSCGNGGQGGAVPIVDGAGRKRMPRRFESPRRFPDSSHGSDTGTASTRESECSEEQQHSPTSGGPVSPLISQSKLYDSLAAELREKLSGGVPLLLPTKDPEQKKEPVHSANDAAARRFRNGCLTGSITPSAGGIQKHGVSSRGSSGIGSDLAPSPERHEPQSSSAPSPERHEPQSSSEDEWVNDQEPTLNGSSHHHHHLSGGRPVERYLDDQPVTRMSKYRDAPPPTTYLYPNVRDEPSRVRQQRSSSREEDRSLQGSVNSREEEVKPIITNHTPRYRNAYKPDAGGYGLEERKKKITIEEKYVNEGARRGGRYPSVEDRDRGEDDFEYGKPQTQPEPTRRYFEEEYDRERYRDSLTDRQKYRDVPADGGKYRAKEYAERRAPERYAERDDYREYSPERLPPVMVSGRSGKYVAPDHFAERQDFKVEREAYRRSPPAHKTDRMRYGHDETHESVERRPMYRSANGPDEEAYREDVRRFASGHEIEQPKRGSYKLPDKYAEHWRQEMSTGYGDGPEPPSGRPAGRYHREEPKHAQPAPALPAADTWKQEPRKKSVEIRTSSPESTMHRISPKDRFQTAKEKFQQMERERHEQERLEQERVERERLLHSKRAVEHVVAPPRRGSLEPAAVSSHESNGWSSDEELPPRGHPRSNGSGTGAGVPNGSGMMGGPGGYRELSPEERYPGLDREAGRRMMPAKSLTSLVKGYRHSYAEPRPPPVSRSSGRVGLAAVNPY